MVTATKHPVPDQVQLSFVIFDIRALWRSGLSVRVPECRKLQMIYSLPHCTSPLTGVPGWSTVSMAHSTLLWGTQTLSWGTWRRRRAWTDDGQCRDQSSRYGSRPGALPQPSVAAQFSPTSAIINKAINTMLQYCKKHVHIQRYTYTLNNTAAKRRTECQAVSHKLLTADGLVPTSSASHGRQVVFMPMFMRPSSDHGKLVQ